MDFEIDNVIAMRQAVKEMCAVFSRFQISEDVLFDCKLVANELLSNVLQHGGECAVLRANLEGDEIVLSVKDRHDYRPPETSSLAPVMQEFGRGLFLVDSLCDRREYSEREGIRVVIKTVKKD